MYHLLAEIALKMQQLLYVLVLAVVVGLYIRDSGLFAPKEVKSSSEQVTKVSSPVVEPEVLKSASIVPTNTFPETDLIGGHSIRVMYCTS